MRRLEELQAFEKIYAPFDGVITARNTDIGALIDLGSSGGARTELFHIVQPDKLRVYVSVPQVYSQAAKPGLSADLVLSEFPGRVFHEIWSERLKLLTSPRELCWWKFAWTIRPARCSAGLMRRCICSCQPRPQPFILPVNALLFRSEGLRVAAVTDGKHAELKAITLGHDFGSRSKWSLGLPGI